MKILLLAPHPFYQERGTPIAVDLLAGALGRGGHTVTLLTYPEGADRTYAGAVRIERLPRLPGLGGVRPGFSLKKLAYDAVMWPRALALARREQPDVVHAVEESVFIAMHIRRRLGIPYVYDMDSSMPDQMAAGAAFFRPFLPFLRRCEAAAARGALAVAPVCDALADKARAAGARAVTLLRDVALFQTSATAEAVTAWRAEQDLTGRVVALYLGNLERYQGVDLLLAALAVALPRAPDLTLVVAGGVPAHIRALETRAAALGLTPAQIRFIGPQPLARMPLLLGAADILVSPRISGTNTPMKIYSYLAAGRAVLATRLPTHTQVLREEIACLADPTPTAMAEALAALARDPARRARLGAAAAREAAAHYTPAAFAAAVEDLYRHVAPTGRSEKH